MSFVGWRRFVMRRLYFDVFLRCKITVTNECESVETRVCIVENHIFLFKLKNLHYFCCVKCHLVLFKVKTQSQNMKSRKSNNHALENEKTKLVELAESHFGKDFFDRLDKLTESYLEKEEVTNYTLTTNYEGAFYAYAK